MNLALFYVVVQSKPYLWHWKVNVTLSGLPNRNKARKLIKFAVFDLFLFSRIVRCFYVRYMYILNQSTNYYTFILQNHETKISIKLLSDVKLLVTIWMEPNIAFFTKVQSGFLTWGASPLLSLAYPVIDKIFFFCETKMTLQCFFLDVRFFYFTFYLFAASYMLLQSSAYNLRIKIVLL